MEGKKLENISSIREVRLILISECLFEKINDNDLKVFLALETQFILENVNDLIVVFHSYNNIKE